MDFRLELDFSIFLCLFFQTSLPFRGSTPLVNIMIRFKACNLVKMESRVSGPLLSQLGFQSHVDCSRTASVFISAVPSWAMSNTPHIPFQGAGSLRCLFFFFFLNYFRVHEGYVKCLLDLLPFNLSTFCLRGQFQLDMILTAEYDQGPGLEAPRGEI